MQGFVSSAVTFLLAKFPVFTFFRCHNYLFALVRLAVENYEKKTELRVRKRKIIIKVKMFYSYTIMDITRIATACSTLCRWPLISRPMPTEW